MMLRKFYRMGLLIRRPLDRTYSNTNKDNILLYLCKYLNLNENEAQLMINKHPAVKKLNEMKMKHLVDTLQDLGYPGKVLVTEPLLLSMLPSTLRFRHRVLKECGIEKVTAVHLASYLPIVKRKTIGQLKRSGEIPNQLDVEKQLTSYMAQWPTSPKNNCTKSMDKYTLYLLRIKIIQRYLELVLELNNEEFYKRLQIYPRIKHRPLEAINSTLVILLSQLMIPKQKIKANLYLIHADPDNLKQIIYNFQTIGGIDIKEIIRRCPKLAMINHSTLFETRKVLQEFNISNEAQTRCFEIYTLGPSTVRERLEKAKTIPEFHTLYNHPRFLKMIYHNTTALKRLAKLYDNNKKCLSLNILTGSSAHYEMFEKASGDRVGKGRDVVFCISQSLGDTYSKNDVRKSIKRHPFWINIPVVQVKYVYQHLSTEFSPNDIYQNCFILLYPWKKIEYTLELFKSQQTGVLFFHEQLDLTKLNNAQKLSLVLYLLERNHYFTGNGVWTEEKSRNVEFTTPAPLQQVIQ